MALALLFLALLLAWPGPAQSQEIHGCVQSKKRTLYARWCGGDSYREPMVLAPGEVPADYLTRMVEGTLGRGPRVRKCQPASTPAGRLRRARGAFDLTARERAGLLERETGFEPATLGLGSRCSTN